MVNFRKICKDCLFTGSVFSCTIDIHQTHFLYLLFFTSRFAFIIKALFRLAKLPEASLINLLHISMHASEIVKCIVKIRSKVDHVDFPKIIYSYFCGHPFHLIFLRVK